MLGRPLALPLRAVALPIREPRDLALIKSENAKLQLICDVQKKVSLLLGLTLPPMPDVDTILDAAFLAHPERFTRGRPVPPSLPTEVWINKPNPEVAMQDAAQ